MTGKQLRNSILQWAIQGKLVPQDPNDEPASVLLERIRAEKARLVKEKKIKKDKNETIIYRGEDNSYYEKNVATGAIRCIDSEIPFDIPQGWEWCRIKNICSMQAGKNISASEIFSDCSGAHPYRCVGGNGLRGYVSRYNTSGHNAIVGRQGALCGCLNLEKGNYYATEHAVIVDTYDILSPEFMYYFLTALNLNQYATATAQPGLAVSNIIEVLFPLPPYGEQVRIIQSLSQLQPKLIQYEAHEGKLNILNDSISIKLKSSILQDAIQGKLVPQIESEGTAEELLAEIHTEKERLIKEGKLKKSAIANESRIFRGDDNKYYEQIGFESVDIDEGIPWIVPSNWSWCRLGEIVEMSMGKTPPRGEQKFWSNGVYPWVSIADLRDGEVITTTKEKVSEEAYHSVFSENISHAGNIVMSFKLTIGKISILGLDAFHNEAIVTISPYHKSNIFKDYLVRVLPYLSQLGNSKDAIKGKTLNSKSLYNIWIPLPPQSEMNRIITKIKEVDQFL